MRLFHRTMTKVLVIQVAYLREISLVCVPNLYASKLPSFDQAWIQAGFLLGSKFGNRTRAVRYSHYIFFSVHGSFDAADSSALNPNTGDILEAHRLKLARFFRLIQPLGAKHDEKPFSNTLRECSVHVISLSGAFPFPSHLYSNVSQESGAHRKTGDFFKYNFFLHQVKMV